MARPPKLPRIGGDWTYPGVEHRHLDPYIDRTFGSQEYLQQQSAPTSTSTSNTHWQVPTNEEERGDNNGYDDGDGKKDDGDNRDDDEDEDEDEGPTNPWLSDEHFLNILPHDSDNVAAVQGSFVAEHRKRGTGCFIQSRVPTRHLCSLIVLQASMTLFTTIYPHLPSSRTHTVIFLITSLRFRPLSHARKNTMPLQTHLQPRTVDAYTRPSGARDNP